MRLHEATRKLCGLTLVLLPEDIWKTHNCTVLPLPWDLFEDASQYVLCICTVQEGIWHCYQIEVKVMWKECNLHQYVEEQSTFKDMVKPPLCKGAVMPGAPFQGELLEDKMPCSAMQAVAPAVCQWGISPQAERFSMSNRGWSPHLALREDSLLVGWDESTGTHRLLCCPFSLISAVLDAVQPLRGWTISKIDKKKAWILLLLQIYFSPHLNVFEIVDPHCQTWRLFSTVIL